MPKTSAKMADLPNGYQSPNSVERIFTNVRFLTAHGVIHSFADGNGRMGRLWQTLILSQWKPLLAYLPVESVIRERQAEYYRALVASDKQGQSTIFIQFLLSTLLQALKEIHKSDQVSDQVKRLL